MKPDRFESGPMRVGFLRAGKLLDVDDAFDMAALEESDNDIDAENASAFSESSVAQLKLEDGMDRRER